MELPNGVFVWWDGLTRAYIDVPASFKGNTMVIKLIKYITSNISCEIDLVYAYKILK